MEKAKWDALTSLLVEGGLKEETALWASSLLDTNDPLGGIADDFASALLRVVACREARGAICLARCLTVRLTDNTWLAKAIEKQERAEEGPPEAGSN